MKRLKHPLFLFLVVLVLLVLVANVFLFVKGRSVTGYTIAEEPNNFADTPVKEDRDDASETALLNELGGDSDILEGDFEDLFDDPESGKDGLTDQEALDELEAELAELLGL